MKNKLSLEEVKMQNELLKNKTERLRLTRNIIAILSILLSIIAFIFGVGKINNGNVESNIQKPNTTNIQENSSKPSNNVVGEDDIENDDDDLE
ncbi:hypothetical protein [Clostridium sp.]|uniref:hypothetical protein n=1 Tax=Clostridium sp. TaxID=1506 RepID=UPI003F326495